MGQGGRNRQQFIQQLQQAFADAEVSLLQTNTLIGENIVVEDDEDEKSLPALETMRQQPVLRTSGSTQALPRGALPTLAGNGHVRRQPCLFSSDQVKPNVAATVASFNGNGRHEESNTPPRQETSPSSDEDGHTKPPIPRPRAC